MLMVSPSPPEVRSWHHTAVQGAGGWAHLWGGMLAATQVPTVSLLQSHCSLQDKDRHMHGALPELVCCALLWALATHAALQSSQVGGCSQTRDMLCLSRLGAVSRRASTRWSRHAGIEL